jgi:sugar phosphate isomerase/epimerase
MKLVMFSKSVMDLSVEDLVPYALDRGLDGYDLAVRPGYPVNPENAHTELPRAAKLFEEAGLAIPIVTAPTDMTDPTADDAQAVLAAMADSGVERIKPGYYRIRDGEGTYQEQLDRARHGMEEWEKQARRYGVKVCYHTHSKDHIGQNGSSLAHLIEGRDPAHIGAFLDTCHLAAEGEEFPTAVTMVRPYLAIVALKDVLLKLESRNGHGVLVREMPEAGGGVVNWTLVFETIRKTGFDGPLSIHCEFEVPEGELHEATKREVAFFRKFL